VRHPGECPRSVPRFRKDRFGLTGISGKETKRSAKFVSASRQPSAFSAFPAIPGSSDATGEPPCDAHEVAISCLIVDDNGTFLHAAQVLLEREGLIVMGVTSTSDEAVRQVQSLHPDVVLVDIFLGEESGLDLARRLSKTYSGDRLTVILISTHSECDAAELIASSTADGFLPKTELSAAAVRTVVEANGRRGT
jgi:CheY-like chemotaxis protein